MKVIGVVGLPGSGKGVFSDTARGMQIPVVVMGDAIRRAAMDEGLPPTDENLGRVANRLRREQGMGAIALLCIPEIDRQKAPLVLVDGIRGDAEVAIFRERYPDFILVGIEAPFEVRCTRLAARGRGDDLRDGEALRRRDEREASWGLLRALDSATVTLTNSGSLEDFEGNVRVLMGKLGAEG